MLPIRATSFPLAVGGSLALLGVAVIAGSAHSWMVPVTLRPDWSANSGVRSATPANAGPDANGSTAPTANADPSETDPSSGAPDTAAAPADDGHYIDLATAKRMLEEEGALFLDARPDAEFEESHVAGAMHLTAEMISSGRANQAVTELVQNYGYDFPIVIYCHGGDCDASDNVAKLLLPMGFRNLRVMKAGFADWQNAGYEVE